MSALLIVGGDSLGKIPDRLEEVGFREVVHVSGRKVQMVKKEIPSHIDLVLVLTDYINHNLSGVLKRRAQEKGIPICYAKRSWCSIYQALGQCQPERCQRRCK